MKEEVSEEVMLGFSANKRCILNGNMVSSQCWVFFQDRRVLALRHSSKKSCVIYK